MPKPRMLVDIDWEETSGVDHPANETEGWLVMKSANTDVEDLIREEAEAIKRHEDLYAALQSALGYLGDAPEEIREAANKLLEYLKESGYAYGYGSPEYSPPQKGREKYPSPRRKLLDSFMSLLSRSGRNDRSWQAAVKARWPEFAREVAAIAKERRDLHRLVEAVNKFEFQVKEELNV